MVARDPYLKRLLAHKDSELIKVITGIRRSGKSMLLKLFSEHLLQNGVLEKNIISINFELMEYDDVRDYRTLYSLIKNQLPETGKCYLMLDEIQQVEHWEKAINSLNIEYDVDIYITGSNAHLLSSEIATLLSGRFVEIKILPLSFKEYLEFEHLPHTWTIDEKFNQYLKFGGFPYVPYLPQDTETVREYLIGIYNTVIVKDVLYRNAIKDVSLLERLVRYVASTTGNFLSPNKISGYLSSMKKGNSGNAVATRGKEKSSSIKNETIANYLDALEKAYVIYRVERYDIRGKELLKTLSKYYLADIGLRNMLVGYTESDIGHVLETVVYFELLRRGYDVYVGKWYDLEVDFVAVKPDDRRYYQVTYSFAGEEVMSRELKPLEAISDNYRKYVLSMDRTYVTGNKGVVFQNIVDFLLEDWS